ncbi:hypothetical protein [Halorussus aquaticus]|uniref:Transposase n=1 Tax=Halorussus aquaticus TaxID=2953748 RepID=A0ABD5Q8W0_9EURY|nr:hypothetical protein [Halorussus aquaticus]
MAVVQLPTTPTAGASRTSETNLQAREGLLHVSLDAHGLRVGVGERHLVAPPTDDALPTRLATAFRTIGNVNP